MRRFQTISLTGMRLIYLVVLSVMFVSSCDKNIPEPAIETLIPIQFSQTQIPTKADLSGHSNLIQGQSVGILAFYLQPDESNNTAWSDTSTPNFMYNQLMTSGNSGQLSYSPIKYWPGNEYDRIKFFAYAPHTTLAETNGNIITLSSATTEGYPTLDYTPSITISKQADLLVAVTGLLNSGSVSLGFKHALTQITFSAQCTNITGQTLSITQIRLNNIANGKGKFTETGFIWENETTTQNYMLSTSDQTLNPNSITDTNEVDISSTTGILYLVPQVSTCTIDIMLTLTPSLGELVKHTIQRTINANQWQQGQKINYKLTIDVANLAASPK